MCDTILAPPSATAENSMLFGKNSDRQRNEAQAVEYFPRAEHESGAPQDSAALAAAINELEWYPKIFLRARERLKDVPVTVTTISSDVLVRTNELRLRDFAVRIPALAYVIDEVPFGANTSIAGSESVPDLDPAV